ncbi:MAG: hypothetical protein LM573_06195, partial [Thermofilum sp.]|nr:hypothetical protein [Thermofilum sp.]
MSFFRGKKEEKGTTIDELTEEIRTSLATLDRKISTLPEVLQEPIRTNIRSSLTQLIASIDELRATLADVLELAQRAATQSQVEELGKNLNSSIEQLKKWTSSLEEAKTTLSRILELVQRTATQSQVEELGKSIIGQLDETRKWITSIDIERLKGIFDNLGEVAETHNLLRESLDNIAKLIEGLSTNILNVENITKTLQEQAEKYAKMVEEYSQLSA